MKMNNVKNIILLLDHVYKLHHHTFKAVANNKYIDNGTKSYQFTLKSCVKQTYFVGVEGYL